MSEKIALVMGGGAGTGRATVLAFGAAGYRVVIADINKKGGEQTLSLLQDAGGQGLFVQADMAELADIERVLQVTSENYGRLHAVSNNAALGTANKPFSEMSEADWDGCMDVALKGVWRAMKLQLPLIESSGGGAIVSIASCT